MALIHGSITYPGLNGIMSGSYTNSHGLTPGCITLRCQMQANAPAPAGDIVFSDNVRKIVIPNCKVVGIRTVASGGGFELSVDLVDRRWKWRDIGIVNGWYNQLDPHGKLVSWTIRSPYEMAIACFKAMGEVPAFVDMPPGLPASIGYKIPDRFLEAGELFPPTGTNPPVDWNAEPPAQALARLCDMFGRRIVYDVVSNRVGIFVVGQGGALPDGSIAQESPSMRIPDTPDGIMVYGSPTKYQGRFALEAVGEEWDGSYRPIEQLSYTPIIAAKQQIWRVVISLGITGVVPPGGRFKITIEGPNDANGDPTILTANYDVQPGDTEADVLNGVLAQLNNNGGVFKTAVNVDTLTLTGNKIDQAFKVIEATFLGWDPDAFGDQPQITAKIRLVQNAAPQKKGWKYSNPPHFALVVATDRLTKYQARQLARCSVYKFYRFTGLDVDESGDKTVIPGFGRIVRNQQVLFTDTKVDQIVPNAGDNLLFDPGTGEPVINEWYRGYSRDKPAECYGAVYRKFITNWIAFAGTRLGHNTKATNPIQYQFSIDPVYQLVKFSQYVFYFNEANGFYEQPKIELETGVNVRDPQTNQLVSYFQTMKLPNAVPGGTGWKVYKHPDVQLNVTAVYFKGNIKSVSILESDPVKRAYSYLQTHTLEYLISGGQTRTYNGLVPIALDGAIMQATYDIGADGVTTQVSRNIEHSRYVPPYPVRRRAEVLQAVLKVGGNG